MTAADVAVDEVADVVAAPLIGTTVYRIRPGELALGLNARRDIPPDPEFAASIAEHGVLQPIVAYVAGPRLQVEMGQRRALFAHEQGLPWVPVVLKDPPAAADRLIEQLVENHHRAPVTLADEAEAARQLTLLGLTVADIARRARRRVVDVEAALRVSASPVAIAAAADAPVDLEQAAAIAAVDDDPGAVARLTDAARGGRGTFEHELQRVADERRGRAEKARVLAEVRESGVTAIDSPDWSRVLRLDALGVTPARHRKCPGHAAIATERQRVVDGRHAWAWGADYVCTRPDLHRATAAAAEQATLTEAARAKDRAAVIEGNREWRSAELVRRRWLRTFARRGRPPTDAATFVAQALVRGDDCLRRAFEHDHWLLLELLAPEDGGKPAAAIRRDDLEVLLAELALQSPARAMVLTVVALLAAWDARTDVHCWRDKTDGHVLGGWRGADTFYMRWLVQFGYEPSPIERRLLCEPDEPVDADDPV